MSRGSQRGRAVRRRPSRSPLPLFPIILGIIVLVGIGALVALVLRDRTQPPIISTIALTAPTGQTADGTYYKGKPDAPVTVLEYGDFQCPACLAFATRLEPDITADYIETGKVHFIYHDYPLPQHGNAVVAAEAARCAGDQGAFWPMHDTLFINQNQWATASQPLSQFGLYAEMLKLDRAGFEQCVSSGKHRDTVLAFKQQAEQAKLSQTPTFFVDGKQILDPSGLATAIDAALAEGQ
jgi:protein-disulfide isomerase